MEGWWNDVYRTVSVAHPPAELAAFAPLAASAAEAYGRDRRKDSVMTTTTTSTLWLAYGSEGRVVGTIRKADGTYTVTMAGAAQSLGSYPTMDIAKNALHGHMTPGSDWPQFRQH